jgi:hypothetical protein
LESQVSAKQAEHQPIQSPGTTYDELGISPTLAKIGFGDAQERMASDVVMNRDFAQSDNEESWLVYRLMCFLYYREYYYVAKTCDERMAAMEKRVKKGSGNRQRLLRIAFSNASDMVLLNRCTALDDYMAVATTVRMYNEMKGAVGGFPNGMVLVRYQWGETCSAVSSCVWCSLLCQGDFLERVEHKYHAVDVSKMLHRHVLTTDEALDERLIRNKAEFAIRFARQLIVYPKTGPTDERLRSFSWHWVFSHEPLEILYYCESFGPGVVTGFSMSKKILYCVAQSNRKSPGLGYWRFDGVTRDCDAKFITFEKDAKYQEEYERLGEIWKEQHDRAIQQNTTKSSKMKAARVLSPLPLAQARLAWPLKKHKNTKTPRMHRCLTLKLK